MVWDGTMLMALAPAVLTGVSPYTWVRTSTWAPCRALAGWTQQLVTPAGTL